MFLEFHFLLLLVKTPTLHKNIIVQTTSNFQVYNASAGSGKTFTLVKEYLKVVLASNDRYIFQKILAITFTNKAANEMKERVLNSLEAFSEGVENDIFRLLLSELKIDKKIIIERSNQVLSAILQNYSAFGITTIDSFTHKIIKSFAFDLGLNINFEVELDSTTLLNQAVDVLISKIGIENDITNTLIEFSLEKANNDKSWDISRDLNEFAKILLNEEDAKHFKNLSSKTISDFTELKKSLVKSQIKIEKHFYNIGERALALIDNANINYTEFAYSGECPKHFIKLKEVKYLKTGDLKFEGRLNTTFEEEKKLYAAKASDESQFLIDDLTIELRSLYIESKEFYNQNYSKYVLNKLALKSLIPLAVLTKINTELTNIKEESNTRLIAEFNQLISENIKGQPAPFIYERIGQKFMHYFIDEMQDTSLLQWQNMIPLIDNALSQEGSNLLLVGDGKQAIYRWRGGKAEQFISLGSDLGDSSYSNPFQIRKEVKKLETNYRSFSEIIGFNNQFFQYASNNLQNETYKKLFLEGNKQLETNKKGGFVSLDFLEKEEDVGENDLKYAKKILEIIENLDKGFSKSEICILVRNKKHGVVIANYLSENEIEITSSETLLLQNSKKVNFIVDVLQVIQHPKDEETLMSVLCFLHSHLELKIDAHSFFKDFFSSKKTSAFQKLKEFGIHLNLAAFYQLPFYEKVEEIIRVFKLISTSDAYVQFFLDVVFDHQRKGTDIQAFLDFWELKKNNLSIVAPDTDNAVQIMTIHKSKGLEFPVVIFPYDIDIYYQKEPKAWLSNLPKEEFGVFEELLVSSSNEIKLVNQKGKEIYNKQREELELDNFNLLYVALTRSVEQLYIVTDKKINKREQVNVNFSSGIFINYLIENSLWNTSQSNYVFGNSKRVGSLEIKLSDTIIQNRFISTSKDQHNIYVVANSSKLWETEQGEAIKFGNLIHEMLSKVYSINDVDKVVKKFQEKGELNSRSAEEVKQQIENIVNHTKLSVYYDKDWVVYNEREIVTVDKQIIIPDRLVFNSENEAVIIDYKTGIPSKNHHQQLLKYANELQLLGIKVEKKLLIYIGESILVEEI